MRRGRVLAAGVALLLALLLVLVAVLTTPRTRGLDGDWETEAVPGSVLGGRALVAAQSNVAVDLVSGTKITIGSVSGGHRAVGAGRLLILSSNRLDGAALDAQQRWTWTAPSGLTLALVATSPTVTIVQGCGGTPKTCTLFGVGQTGNLAWSLPQPTSSATSAPVVGLHDVLPLLGVLPAGEGAWNLIDPDSSRVVTRAGDSAEVIGSGAVVLRRAEGSSCQTLAFTSLRGAPASATGPECSLPAAVAPTQGASLTRLPLWYWPFGEGRYAVDVAGRHTGRVVSSSPLTVLRVDDDGVTVREGEKVRRYMYAAKTGTMSP